LTRSTRPSRSCAATATAQGIMQTMANRVIGAKPVDGLTVGVNRGRSVTEMLPLYHDPHFTFRFADDRIIPRFHLEGIEAGRRVTVFKIDPTTGDRLDLLTMAAVGDQGWVDLPVPVVVKAGDAFIAVPEPAQDQ